MSSHLGSASFVSIISATVFDVLVVGLTVYRTGRLAIESRKSGIKGSLSMILLRDGSYLLFSLSV